MKKKAKKEEPQTQETQQNLPPEIKEKMEKIKSQLDEFKKKLLAKFDKYIIGIALLPPNKPKEENPDITLEKINVLVLVDDADSKTMPKEDLQTKLTQIVQTIAQEINKNIEPQSLLLSELRQSCFDGKYDVLKSIAMSAPIYDPTDIIAALKISEIHKTMTLEKFEKYIVSYVAAGSLFRGEKSNDIDVYIIVDDTDVKKMTRAELKDKLRAIIIGMGMQASQMTGIKKAFHIQTYILTDFWDNVKDANPVIFTFLRDGVPLYDRGVFMPWKLLLEMGRIKPSPEAIDMNMELGERLIERIKAKMLSVVGEDLYYAVLNPAQAALMLYGIPPPTPKETIKLMEEIFVKKEKILEQKYVDILERIREAYKNIEHGKLKEVSGKDIDEMLKDATDYLKRIKGMFKEISEKTEKERIIEVYDACIGITKDLLSTIGVKNAPTTKIVELFKEKLVEEEKISEKYLKTLKEVIKAKEEFEAGKITSQEVEKTKKEARRFIKELVEHMQRKKAVELERVKVRFKYGDKFGEAILLDNIAFIVKDLEQRDEIWKAKLTPEGGLNQLEKSTLEEFEKHMANAAMPSKVFIKEKIFEDLKNIFGTKIEILVSY
ncbi:hypothetical protein HY643_02000, partial [Candidatus Woesearchaeota archaeon]|nr:hypothetical protein [Candidatus Woesearchaeota archaeon]